MVLVIQGKGRRCEMMSERKMQLMDSKDPLNMAAFNLERSQSVHLWDFL